jgi:hypothetical protein
MNNSEPKIYMVDGKEWIVGEKKISKWSQAKCNKDEKKEEEKTHDKHFKKDDKYKN